MRLTISIACAAALLIPAGAPSIAGSTPQLASQPAGALDVSSARKKGAKRKPVKKEQYLRAVPSAPPAGTRM